MSRSPPGPASLTEPVDKQPAQVFIAPFGDANESRLTASGDLPRDQSQPGRRTDRTGNKPFSFSKEAYRERHCVENAFCRLKDFRRIATRYDRLARIFLASVYLAATIVW
jgi:transposase